jgi:signal transduction histidine kinase
VSLFENLFRNAVEHGGDVIVADLTADGFAVADDGPGLDESERERAFEPGYSTDDGGTGLGLAIVERTAAAHGWRVEVSDDGEPDGGARFEFHGVDACEE